MTKNLRLASMAVVLLLSLGATAQQNSRSGAVRVSNPDSVTTARKAVMLAGRVSGDGKVLLSEDQDQWAVSNPGALAAHAGHLVTVKCQLSADQNSIHSIVGEDP